MDGRGSTSQASCCLGDVHGRTDGWSHDAYEVNEIIDDGGSLRLPPDRLLRVVGLDTRTYRPAGAFINAPQPNLPGCIVLDV